MTLMLNDFINFLTIENVLEEYKHGIKYRLGKDATIESAWLGLHHRTIVDRSLSWGSMPSGSGLWSALNIKWMLLYKKGKPIKLKGCKTIW